MQQMENPPSSLTQTRLRLLMAAWGIGLLPRCLGCL
jgi:hypothetical protein